MRRFLLLSLLMAFSVLVFAQTKTVTGSVIDEAGAGVPFASITEKGTNRGVSADADGNFSINTRTGAVLVVTATGFGTQEVTVGRGSSVTVALSRGEGQVIDEVVVTALGIRRETRSLGYSTQVVEAEKLENARALNVVDALAGQAAGVRINTQSGALGASSKIIIRGGSSLDRSSQPIFVVDGVILSNTSFTAGTTGKVDYGNGISDINPDDIATLTVLKGPAATAQYGSLAKDGAIIITTKKGSKGRVQIDVNSSYRMDNPLRLPDFQTNYAQGTYGVYNLRFTNGWGPKISAVQDQKFPDFLGRQVTLQAYPDNVRNFFITGNSYINSIGISGGDEKADFRLGYGNVAANGIVPNQKQSRNNISANVGYKFSEKFSGRVTSNYVKNKVFGRPEQSSNSPNILTSSVYSIPVTVNINDLKKNYQDSLGNQIFLSSDKNGNNPYWIAYKNMHNSDQDRFFGSAFLEYKPIEWLSITNNVGYDYAGQVQNSFNRQGTAGDMLGSYEDYSLTVRRVMNDIMVTARKNLNEDINLKVMLGNSVLDRKTFATDIIGKNLIIDNFYRPNNAQTVTTTENLQQQRLVSFYGEISPSYKNFLYLTFTGRNDISSTLPVQNRSYFYYSAGGSLVFSELIPKNDVLSFGNLRMSYAQVGSDASPYSLETTYSAPATFFAQFSLPGTFPFLSQQGFTAPRVLPNAELKPQIAGSYEIGTNLKFFRNRIGVDFTYYNTKTKNQIIDVSVPRSTGYFSKTINAGSVTNSGYEVVLDLHPIQTVDGFNWDLTTNFSHNKQIVNELIPELSVYTLASGWSGLQVKAEKGKPFALYGTKWQRSPDGQFIIDPANGLRLFEADKYIGDINPDYLLGVSNNFSYKGVSLGFLVDARQGGVFYSGTVAALRSSGMVVETEANRDGSFIDKGVNAVTSNGTTTYVPNATPVQSMQDFWARYSATSNTEGNVFDASYVKLRSVNLSYVFPKNVILKNIIRSLEIGLEGRNLWLIKSFVPHVDPEMNFFGNGSNGDGVEFNSFPTTRSLGVNLKIKF